MGLISTEAFLIHKKPQGNTSAMVYVFTEKRGLIPVRFRGVRIKKKQFPLEPFAPLWCALAERHGYYYANTMEMIQSGYTYSGVTLFSALYVNELLYYTMPQGEPDENLYACYHVALCGLAGAQQPEVLEKTLRCFEMQLLKCLGYNVAPMLPLDPTQTYCFQPGAGFLEHPEGFSGDDINTILSERFETSKQRMIAKKILRQAIEHLLNGRRLLSRELLMASRVSFTPAVPVID